MSGAVNCCSTGAAVGRWVEVSAILVQPHPAPHSSCRAHKQCTERVRFRPLGASSSERPAAQP